MTSAAETVNAVAAQPSRLSALPDAQQLELLRDRDGNLDRHNIHLVRGRGRPPGAKNRRTKKVADYICSRYGDPVDVLGQLTTMPLKTLVDVLREADNAHDREEHLAHLAELVERQLSEAISGGVVGSAANQRQLASLVDRLGDVAKVLRATPGKLALDALQMQIAAAVKLLEYVHGKQPISIEVAGKADLVIFAPEILKNYGIDAGELEQAIGEHGLEGFDVENMRLIEHAEDAEFEAADDGPESDPQ